MVSWGQINKVLLKGAKYLTNVIKDPTVQKCLGTGLVASIATGLIVDNVDKNSNAEKAELYKEKLQKQQAIIEALTKDAQLSKERQDYLAELNKELIESQKAVLEGDVHE